MNEKIRALAEQSGFFQFQMKQNGIGNIEQKMLDMKSLLN